MVHDKERWDEIKDKDFSAPDGGYVDERNQEHYVEVITASYTKDRLDAKFSTENLLGGSLDITRV